jgi:hypothetical protein
MAYQAMYAGEKINLEGGVPELRTIGISLARLVRFTGNQEGVYTVLPHSLVVAALMPAGEGIYGLMHDAHESVTNDVPRPMKCEGHTEIEDIISERIRRAYGIPPMPAAVAKRLKKADNAALVAEAYVVGYSDPMYDWFEEEELIPDQKAMRLTRRYVQEVARWMFGPELSGPLFERKYKHYMEAAGLQPVTFRGGPRAEEQAA